jgi:competence protein ComEC
MLDRVKPEGLVSALVRAIEQDRWFFWLPVLFAGGVLTYFAPIDEPQTGLRLVIGALGLCLAARHAPLGLCLGARHLPLPRASPQPSFPTEMARAPVLTHKLRYVGLTESRRDLRAARQRTGAAYLAGSLSWRSQIRSAPLSRAGEPAGKRRRDGGRWRSHCDAGDFSRRPSHIAPGGFDFGRRAWFARLGATGHATSKWPH